MDYSKIFVIFEYLDAIKTFVNSTCEGLEPWQIILYTVVTVFFIMWFERLCNDSNEPFTKRTKRYVFKRIESLPIIKDKIKSEMDKIKDTMSARKIYKLNPGMMYVRSLPEYGLTQSQVLNETDKYLTLDNVDWKSGNVSGAIYNGDDSLKWLTTKIYSKFVWSNPLHPDIFPATRKMEAEVVRMACTMFHGDPIESCGSVSSGGTESILLACKAYRTWAYEKGIKYPEILCPISVHAAFDKAADYFQMKIVHVPLDSRTWKVDIVAMKKAINKNTCMLVGSAPNFPHGIIDPIPEIAKLGEKYGIPVHVDACLGGFLVAFMDEAGFPLERFDFRLSGVTSISADTHKYGYTPKGTSCVLYSSKKWIHYQYFVAPDWQGGIYATPTFSGSRAGALIAVCWATMQHFGRKGYVECTHKVISTCRYIKEALYNIENIYVIGEPKVSIIAIASLDFDIYVLSSKIIARGWNLNVLQFPPCFHLCCTMLHTQPGVADRFIGDVAECVREIMSSNEKKATGGAAIYGMAQSIPDRSLVSELALSYVDACYDTSAFEIRQYENGYK